MNNTVLNSFYFWFYYIGSNTGTGI